MDSIKDALSSIDIKPAMLAYKKAVFDEIKPLSYKPNDPGYVALFSSTAQMNMWIFCQGNHITFTNWKKSYRELHDKDAPPEYFDDPVARPNPVGAEDVKDFFYKINPHLKGTSPYERTAKCQICHGTGLAYIIRGPLIQHDTPSGLKATICICRR